MNPLNPFGSVTAMRVLNSLDPDQDPVLGSNCYVSR